MIDSESIEDRENIRLNVKRKREAEEKKEIKTQILEQDNESCKKEKKQSVARKRSIGTLNDLKKQDKQNMQQHQTKPNNTHKDKSLIPRMANNPQTNIQSTMKQQELRRQVQEKFGISEDKSTVGRNKVSENKSSKEKIIETINEVITPKHPETEIEEMKKETSEQNCH
ncbi:unnamed protein product [Brachionus calyciflorus]|uniref:Uncharacterized protein n=1 Tax=Brachionus calyciflorus TaxID=104777 RepID=A0A814H7X9_9BILA|nr:unnamed protein product [Brachionus calyciflorus]